MADDIKGKIEGQLPDGTGVKFNVELDGMATYGQMQKLLSAFKSRIDKEKSKSSEKLKTDEELIKAAREQLKIDLKQNKLDQDAFDLAVKQAKVDKDFLEQLKKEVGLNKASQALVSKEIKLEKKK